MFLPAPSIQHSTGGPRQCNKAIRRNKISERIASRKELKIFRSKRYNNLCRKFQRIYKQVTRTNN